MLVRTYTFTLSEAVTMRPDVLMLGVPPEVIDPLPHFGQTLSRPWWKFWTHA
jgi:hypothetical protein